MILGIKAYVAAGIALLMSVGGGYMLSKQPSPNFEGGVVQSFDLLDASGEGESTKFQANATQLVNARGTATPQCGWEREGLLRTNVLLNELAWMGGHGEASADREWIELVNRGTEDISLAGWELLDKADQIHVVFGARDAIPAGGFYLLERANDGAVPGFPADKIYEGSLGNTNEGLKLFERGCVLRDEARANPSWPAGVNETKRTMERNPEGFGWHTSVASEGTPRERNSIPPPPPPPAPLGAVSIIADDPNASEDTGNVGSFKISRTGPTNVSLKVFYEVGGAALEAVDYEAVNGMRVIPEGKDATYITIRPVNDNILESTERVTITLTGTGYAPFIIGTPKVAHVDIVDNDAVNPPPPVAPPPLPVPPPPPPLSEDTSVLCADGIDNDGDGLIDLNDPDCAPFIPPPPPPSREDTLALCSDGVDNDGDGLVDLNDPDCAPFIPPPPPASTASNVSHILISEIQMSGGPGATTNDFIEIYNPTDQPFNLNGHRLVKRTANAATDTLLKSWTSDTFIPARGFYLWANSSYTGIPITPDVTTSGSIASNNGIAIREGANDTGTIIDSVAWGTVTNGFGEGTLLGDLGDSQSFERKMWNGTCGSAQGSGEALGNGCDNGDNLSDFEIRGVPTPQNALSVPEP